MQLTKQQLQTANLLSVFVYEKQAYLITQRRVKAVLHMANACSSIFSTDLVN